KTAAMLTLDLDNIRAAWHSAVDHFDINQIARFVVPLHEFYTHIGFDFELEGLLEDAQAIFKQNQTSIPQQLDCLFKLILLDLKSGHLTAHEFEPLFKAFLQQLEDWDSKEQPLYKAKAYYYLTDTLERGESRYDLEETAEKALQLAYAAGDQTQIGEALCTQALHHARRSKLDQAIACLDGAIKIFEKIGDIKGLARAVYTMAPTWSENGSFWKGLIYDRRAVELYEQLGYERKLANAHMGIALSYNLLGAYDKARWHGNQTLSRYRKLGIENGIHYGYCNLAETAMMEGNFDEAIPLYLRCVEYRRATKNYVRLRDEGFDAARSLWKAGRYSEALEIAEEVIQLRTKSGIEEDLDAAQILLANIYWDLGRQDEGLALALKVFQNDSIKKMQNPTQASYELYRLFGRANHPNKMMVLKTAHEIVEQMASEITEMAFLQSFLYNASDTKKLTQAFSQHNLPKIAPHVVPAQKDPSPIS
ncbi:MAG: tetratricopeptide repeat protein, partial [Chloroflexota bacterium]